DFRGTPTGIDVRLVAQTGILPQINTGMAHREAGIGQIGAGLVNPPRVCFDRALDALVQNRARAATPNHRHGGGPAMYAQAFKVGMRAPDDVSEAARLLDARAFSAEHVVAILGKTEGNGGVNDFTRALATLSFRMLIAERSGQIGRASCRERVERWGVAEA